MTQIGSLRRELRKAYRRRRNGGGWRAVGRDFGISGGMAFRIARRGYEPKEAKIRVRLGLPAMVEVAACEVCGEVHVGPHPKGGGGSRPARTDRKLFDVPLWELRWMIKHRKVVNGK